MPENTILGHEGPGRTDGKQQLSPDHWSVFLRCTICFGFLDNPHTIECGHSFCKRCLKRLAEIVREDSPSVSLRRLNLSCPTCRYLFPAKPALTGRIHNCIVLKQLVELWKRECKAIASTPVKTIRSVGCQTRSHVTDDRGVGLPEKPGHDLKRADSDPQEEVSSRLELSQEHCDIIVKRVLESWDELMNEATNPKGDVGLTLEDGDRRELSDSESSAASSSSDVHLGSNNPSLSNISLPDRLHHVGLPHMIYLSSDNCPGRLLLMSVWSIYSLVIVALAETSLPYVILFTLFFFLIILR